jgi:hypothetical protein
MRSEQDASSDGSRLARALALWRRFRGDLLGVSIVAVAIMLAYSDVAFHGKTFSTAREVVGADGCAGERCAAPSRSVPDPRVDVAASAWQFEPWAQVTASQLHTHTAPLWNPYEGAGTPLAANMQSATFDPLLALVNVHPTPLTWDLTFLGTLILNGVAAYALARTIRLGVAAAVVAGAVYGLSGYFFFLSNNAFFRAQVYLPIVLLGIEWVLRSSRMFPILACALAVAGLVVAGMPEITFAVLFFSAIYGAVRLVSGPRAMTRRVALTRLAGAGILGLAVSAPLLLPFREYVSAAMTFKEGAGLRSAPRSGLLNWFAPNIGRACGTAAGPCSGRTWSGGLNWVGGGALAASAAGIASRRQMSRCCGWPVLAAGGVVAAKIYGVPVVTWLGHLPGAAQTNWVVFGQATLAFAVALLAAIGVNAIAHSELNPKVGALILGLGAAAGAYGMNRNWSILRHDFDVTDAGGLGFAVLAGGLVALCVVASVFLGRTRAIAALLASGVIVAELLALAPHGFYDQRSDPYPRRNWTDFLVSHTRTPDVGRVFSNDNVLFPDTAGAYRLQDPRMIDGLFIHRYFDYVKSFISHGIFDRWTAAPNYETGPAITGNPMFDLLGVRYVVVTEPRILSGSQYVPVRRFGPIYVYRNAAAMPRAFVVGDIRVEANEHAARRFLTEGQPRHLDGSFVARVDPRRTAVLEGSTADRAIGALERSRCTSPTVASVKIVRYESTRIEIRLNTPCPGVLVLTDAYYPGWAVTVNDQSRTIYPTDYAFRGVVVAAGASRVVFSYEPRSLRAGLVIALSGLLAFVVIGVVVRARSARADERAMTRHDSQLVQAGRE